MSTVLSVISSGMVGRIVEVEATSSKGIPSLIIIGLATKAIEESKERVRSAFYNLGIKLPKKRIVINLAPADMPKDSTTLDLAIAIAILIHDKQIQQNLKSYAFVGELGLSGQIRPVNGIIGKLNSLKAFGSSKIFIPKNNLKHATLVEGVTLYPVDDLKQVMLFLNGKLDIPKYDSISGIEDDYNLVIPETTISDIKGQNIAKRGLIIASAGRHNILLSGPPGSGKTLLAKSVLSILPVLTKQQVIESTNIHSLIKGMYDFNLVVAPPFRSPHHIASDVAVIGGGVNSKPGEISLAHNGVLFLDEFPEFGKKIIEALRQPIEDKIITIARAKEVVSYPCNFMLIATKNPCPCGYYNSTIECHCSTYEIDKYQKRISGPILDRIDICINVPRFDNRKIMVKQSAAHDLDNIKNMIVSARQKQYRRFGQDILNSNVSTKKFMELISIDPKARDILNQFSDKYNISARQYIKIIRVAQTIADLDSDGSIIKMEHVLESLSYRETRL